MYVCVCICVSVCDHVCVAKKGRAERERERERKREREREREREGESERARVHLCVSSKCIYIAIRSSATDYQAQSVWCKLHKQIPQCNAGSPLSVRTAVCVI